VWLHLLQRLRRRARRRLLRRVQGRELGLRLQRRHLLERRVHLERRRRRGARRHHADHADPARRRVVDDRRLQQLQGRQDHHLRQDRVRRESRGIPGHDGRVPDLAEERHLAGRRRDRHPGDARQGRHAHHALRGRQRRAPVQLRPQPELRRDAVEPLRAAVAAGLHGAEGQRRRRGRVDRRRAHPRRGARHRRHGHGGLGRRRLDGRRAGRLHARRDHDPHGQRGHVAVGRHGVRRGRVEGRRLRGPDAGRGHDAQDAGRRQRPRHARAGGLAGRPPGRGAVPGAGRRRAGRRHLHRRRAEVLRPVRHPDAEGRLGGRGARRRGPLPQRRLRRLRDGRPQPAPGRRHLQRPGGGGRRGVALRRGHQGVLLHRGRPGLQDAHGRQRRRRAGAEDLAGRLPGRRPVHRHRGRRAGGRDLHRRRAEVLRPVRHPDAQGRLGGRGARRRGPLPQRRLRRLRDGRPQPAPGRRHLQRPGGGGRRGVAVGRGRRGVRLHGSRSRAGAGGEGGHGRRRPVRGGGRGWRVHRRRRARPVRAGGRRRPRHGDRLRQQHRQAGVRGLRPRGRGRRPSHRGRRGRPAGLLRRRRGRHRVPPGRHRTRREGSGVRL
ncbi:MAG: GH16, partial [uncultured Acetobacteraceae bacterium]